MWLKQLRKIFKVYFARSRSSTSTNSKDEAICNNSLQLKVVNVSIVISSFISDLGRGPGPASYNMGFCVNSCEVSDFTKAAFNDVLKVSFVTVFLQPL